MKRRISAAVLALFVGLSVAVQIAVASVKAPKGATPLRRPRLAVR